MEKLRLQGRKHTCLTLTDSEEWAAPLLYKAAMTRAQKEGEGVCTAHGAPTPYIDMLFFFLSPGALSERGLETRYQKSLG